MVKLVSSRRLIDWRSTVKLEIHHDVPTSQGGNVYGVDNLRLYTPANHDKIHTDLRNEGRDNER
jgi:hypothetical protein